MSGSSGPTKQQGYISIVVLDIVRAPRGGVNR
jgi:hypothetical protein